MSDTSEAAREVQAGIHRRLGGLARLELAFEMSLMARDLALLRLRGRYPGQSDRELLLHLRTFE